MKLISRVFWWPGHFLNFLAHCDELKTASLYTENDVEKPIFQDQIDPESQSIEEILMGMSSQIGEREDNVLCSDVRNMLFGPMEFSRRDLAALNIMRGRDNGLPDYNEVRKCHGLPKITEWEQINPKSYQEEPDIFEKMAEVYQNLVSYKTT